MREALLMLRRHEPICTSNAKAPLVGQVVMQESLVVSATKCVFFLLPRHVAARDKTSRTHYYQENPKLR